MEKCRKLWYNQDKSLEEYKYLAMLDLGIKELEKLSKKDKVVSKYMETLEEVNQDPEFREYMSIEEDAIKMEKSRISAGIKKGLEQGLEQGIKKGSREKAISIAKSLLKNNVDINIIAESTGLSIEELEKLKNKDN